ncbi:MAG: ParB N-terminal domain-containing protein [Parvularcula sp.]|jgi:ParB family chromosome partitioning protein|nr:ParB N-terminal domain-containing protein [Parvularcula sp.]
MKRQVKVETETAEGPAIGASRITIETIVIPEGGRPSTKKVIEGLAASMKAIGLLTPIMIRFEEAEGSDADLRPTLVAGARRLEAARSLGWTAIDCIIVQESSLEAEMRAIAENLHRRVLTKHQRDEHIRRYAVLLGEREQQTGQNGPFESKREDGKGHRRKGLAAIIAVETGLSKKTIDRALNPADSAPSKTKSRLAPSEVTKLRLQKAWAKADEAEREWFLKWVQSSDARPESDAPSAGEVDSSPACDLILEEVQ